MANLEQKIQMKVFIIQIFYGGVKYYLFKNVEPNLNFSKSKLSLRIFYGFIKCISRK